ncbi:MAG: DUF3618 domain-containing protein [Ancrocorticia sp.]|uniref:DUF3618 domain-containing protein n=1 Tax=Ancrocorticia sp. TaxID=2593684 RepID=UPI003F92A5DA
MSPAKSEDQIRSAQQIENDLKRQREELANTVNELASRLDPKAIAQDAQDQAKEKANEAAEKARDFVDEVKSGNILYIGISAASALAGIGLIALRRRRKK